jgi:Zinc-binding dehydrogenase
MKVSGWFALARAGPWSIDRAYGIWTDGGTHRAKPARVFRFEAIENAHRLMESKQENGKLVVTFEVSLKALSSEPPEEEYTNS